MPAAGICRTRHWHKLNPSCVQMHVSPAGQSTDVEQSGVSPAGQEEPVAHATPGPLLVRLAQQSEPAGQESAEQEIANHPVQASGPTH